MGTHGPHMAPPWALIRPHGPLAILSPFGVVSDGFRSDSEATHTQAEGEAIGPNGPPGLAGNPLPGLAGNPLPCLAGNPLQKAPGGLGGPRGPISPLFCSP